jgi:2-oxoglutarate ferredoxin oxidoreductase subunit delta
MNTANGRSGCNIRSLQTQCDEVNMTGRARGKVMISIEECKGCGLCVESCPPKCLFLALELSAYGVHPAHYTGQDCTGCGICFYCCPEPGAVTVYRLVPPTKAMTSQLQGADYAPPV